MEGTQHVHSAEMKDRRKPTKVMKLFAIMKSGLPQVSCGGLGGGDDASWAGHNIHRVPQPHLGPIAALLPQTQVAWWLCLMCPGCTMESHLGKVTPHSDTFGELS